MINDKCKDLPKSAALHRLKENKKGRGKIYERKAIDEKEIGENQPERIERQNEKPFDVSAEYVHASRQIDQGQPRVARR